MLNVQYGRRETRYGRQTLFAVAVFLTACSVSSDAPVPRTYAERLAVRVGYEPLDYAEPSNWACRGERRDTCAKDYPMARMLTDGTQSVRVVEPDLDAPADCFFVYPTMDWQPFFAENHTDLDNLWLPTRDTETQAGPFSSVCRVFAPYYRQGNIGAYATDPDNGVFFFRRAFVDVAAAFEYYLRHWNQGRPVVVFGHSQGAMHAAFLLHAYFDGGDIVTDIPGSESTAELRDRLLAGMPLGGLVFVEKGKRSGGSFSDLPLCVRPAETGCIISYRSFPEGFTFSSRVTRGAHDILTAEGFTYTSFDEAKHVAACVNPAMGASVPVTEVTDGDGAAVLPGDLRSLAGTWLVGIFTEIQFGAVTTPRAKDLPGRYVAACRHDEKAGDYLTIGLRAPPGGDRRGDPVDIGGLLANTELGLHLFDVNLAMGDLVTMVRLKTAAWQANPGSRR